MMDEIFMNELWLICIVGFTFGFVVLRKSGCRWPPAKRRILWLGYNFAISITKSGHIGVIGSRGKAELGKLESLIFFLRCHTRSLWVGRFACAEKCDKENSRGE